MCVPALTLYVCIKCALHAWRCVCVCWCVGHGIARRTVVVAIVMLCCYSLSLLVCMCACDCIRVSVCECECTLFHSSIHLVRARTSSILQRAYIKYVYVCVYTFNNTEEVCTYKNTNSNAYIQQQQYTYISTEICAHKRRWYLGTLARIYKRSYIYLPYIYTYAHLYLQKTHPTQRDSARLSSHFTAPRRAAAP